MKIEYHCDAGEDFSIIGIAKALIETSLSYAQIGELAQYLRVFADAHLPEKGGGNE